MASVALDPSDLAPGDARSASFDWKGFEILQIPSPKHPLFGPAYTKLWDEFGPFGEMEQKEIITHRLAWDPSKIESGFSLSYEMLVVLYEGKLVAVRDHAAIVRVAQSPNETTQAIVHLSHVLVDPLYRRSGLAGWLRAWPIQKARSALKAAGFPENSPIVLAAEMEPYDAAMPKSTHRLQSYQKANFLMVDPTQAQYFQPDFRNPSEIDSNGGPRPLPLRLIIRRVNRENEREMTGRELKKIASSLYQMYSSCFRSQDMAGLWEQLKVDYPSETTKIRLLDPTEHQFS